MSERGRSDINRILINATQSEEIRVAITTGQFLDNLFIEEIGSHRTGNIYKAKITRVVPSLQAAFVDFGSERHGFLPLKEIAPEYFSRAPEGDDFSIADVLSEGQELIVQVEKEERGTKGAALTSFITLAGCYLVLMPNNPSAGGISRRIEGDDRDTLREHISNLNVPEEMGLIIRTAGVGRAQEEIAWDLDILLRLWTAIQESAASRNSPFLIYQESDIVIRALRDYLRRDISEIIIDSPDLYNKALQHVTTIRPEFRDHIKLYQDKAVPLFTRYRIEDQIETAFLRDVQLPSGGYIVIQGTEAMVTIDVNSARDTKGGNIEQTAFNTNREAAIEVARQLRLRDIGGLIAIDFIDMISTENQQKIVDVFKDETRNDKARVQFGRISRFGILEVSRQRLRPSLTESSQIVCPRCSGQGSIRSVESLGLLLLRLIRQEALHDNVVGVNVQVPIDVATFLINEKRHALSEIEAYHHTMIRILPNPHIETPQYKLERIYDNQSGQVAMTPSFKQVEKVEFQSTAPRATTATNRYSEPAIKGIEAPEKPAGTRKESGSVFTRLWQVLTGAAQKLPEKVVAKEASQATSESKPRRQQRQRGRNNNRQQKQSQYQRNPYANSEKGQREKGERHNRDHANYENTASEKHGRKHHERSAAKQERHSHAAPRADYTPPVMEPVVAKAPMSEQPKVAIESAAVKPVVVIGQLPIKPTAEQTVVVTPTIITEPVVRSNYTEAPIKHEPSKISEKPVQQFPVHAPTNATVESHQPAATFVAEAQSTTAGEATDTATAAEGQTDQKGKRRYRHHRNRYRQRGYHRRNGGQRSAEGAEETASTDDIHHVDD
jgi:ribonuclease E